MRDEQKLFICRLCKEHAEKMYWLSVRRTGDHTLSQDLVQEVFLTACSKANIVCAHENPAGWLYNALRKLTLRELDKSYHQDILISDSILSVTSEADDIQLPLEAYLPHGLTDRERTLIVMRLEQNKPYSEIAEVLDIPVDSCRVMYSRALKKCKDLLSEPTGVNNK